MPIYEFRCKNGHQFEVMQRMSDEPVTKCTVCGAPVERVFHPIAVHFKGSGFYNTDYGTRKRSREKEAHDGAKAASSKSDSKDSGGSKSDSGASKSDSGASKSDSGGKSKPATASTTGSASSSKSD
jgi:putative FmdB family regulatory protein